MSARSKKKPSRRGGKGNRRAGSASGKALRQRSLREGVSASGTFPSYDAESSVAGSQASAPKQPQVACVEFPEFALQIARRSNPRWRDDAIALVDSDRPDAPLLRVCPQAEQMGVTAGMRLGAARTLAPELRAAIVSKGLVRATHEALVEVLQGFTPGVEGTLEASGLFYLDPKGLAALLGPPAVWADSILRELTRRGFIARVAVGFDRHRLRAALVATPAKRLMLESPEQERSIAGRAKLLSLGLSAALTKDLGMLGIRHLDELAKLPSDELRTRFGEDAARWRDRFEHDEALPLQASPFDTPFVVTRELSYPTRNLERLLFALKAGLAELLDDVCERHRKLVALELLLHGEDGEQTQERLEPASPTRDQKTLLELVHLRLAKLKIKEPIERFSLGATVEHASQRQLLLPSEKPERDLDAAAKALARLRALWGDEAVCRAKVRDAHLPEAQFEWEPVKEARISEGHGRGKLERRSSTRREGERRGADRRAGERRSKRGASRSRASEGRAKRTQPERRQTHPRQGEQREGSRRQSARRQETRRQEARRQETRRSSDRHLGHETIRRAHRRVRRMLPRPVFLSRAQVPREVALLSGPFRLSGGWWARRVTRDYYYGRLDRPAHASHGALAWVFYDHVRRSWFLQGFVD